jgi:hypothetical protein
LFFAKDECHWVIPVLGDVKVVAIEGLGACPHGEEALWRHLEP